MSRLQPQSFCEAEAKSPTPIKLRLRPRPPTQIHVTTPTRLPPSSPLTEIGSEAECAGADSLDPIIDPTPVPALTPPAALSSSSTPSALKVKVKDSEVQTSSSLTSLSSMGHGAFSPSSHAPTSPLARYASPRWSSRQPAPAYEGISSQRIPRSSSYSGWSIREDEYNRNRFPFKLAPLEHDGSDDTTPMYERRDQYTIGESSKSSLITTPRPARSQARSESSSSPLSSAPPNSSHSVHYDHCLIPLSSPPPNYNHADHLEWERKQESDTSIKKKARPERSKPQANRRRSSMVSFNASDINDSSIELGRAFIDNRGNMAAIHENLAKMAAKGRAGPELRQKQASTPVKRVRPPSKLPPGLFDSVLSGNKLTKQSNAWFDVYIEI